MKEFLDRLLKNGRKRTPLLWFTGLVIFLVISLLVVLSRNGLPSVEDAQAASDSISTAGLFLDVLLKLGIILFIIFGLYRLAKYFQKDTVMNKNSQLQILETVRLSPGQSLHLVQVGDCCLIIGATDHNINQLSEIDLPPEVLAAYQQADGGQEFSNLFQKLVQERFQQSGKG